MSEEQNQEMSDDEAIMRIAQAMKDNVPAQDEKHNTFTFLTHVVNTDENDRVVKIGNLRDDKELDEIGRPQWNVRGALGMARISKMLMNNPFYERYFERQAWETLASSLSREGFLIRQATTTTKAVADVTRRRKINKGMFGKKNTEESGGDPYGRSSEQ